MVLLVIAIVSAALIAGAVWGLWIGMSKTTEGLLLALAGGALIHALVAEMLAPAVENSGLLPTVIAALAGAAVFTFADRAVDRRMRNAGGWGLMLAIMLDGIPENLALGVTLIHAGPLEAAALAGAILLSNLPEAAGGAREMARDGMSRGKGLALWSGAAVLLSGAALAGNKLLAGVPEAWLGPIDAFAAGAVVASLAAEVFPKAFEESHFATGIAVAAGLLLALGLGELGG